MSFSAAPAGGNGASVGDTAAERVLHDPMLLSAVLRHIHGISVGTESDLFRNIDVSCLALCSKRMCATVLACASEACLVSLCEELLRACWLVKLPVPDPMPRAVRLRMYLESADAALINTAGPCMNPQVIERVKVLQMYATDFEGDAQPLPRLLASLRAARFDFAATRELFLSCNLNKDLLRFLQPFTGAELEELQLYTFYGRGDVTATCGYTSGIQRIEAAVLNLIASCGATLRRLKVSIARPNETAGAFVTAEAQAPASQLYARLQAGILTTVAMLPRISRLMLSNDMTEVAEDVLPMLAPLDTLRELNLCDSHLAVGADIGLMTQLTALKLCDMAPPDHDDAPPGDAGQVHVPAAAALPPEGGLANLRGLQRLEMTSDVLPPQFRSAIAHLTGLTRLQLRFASRPLLQPIAALTGLRDLRLAFTEPSGVPVTALRPLTAIAGLQCLCVGKVTLGTEAECATVLRGLPALRTLELRNMSDSVPLGAVAVLPRLRHLSVGYEAHQVMAAVHGIEKLAECPRLRVLRLASVALGREEVGALLELQGLRALALQNLEVDSPTTLAAMRGFTFLRAVEVEVTRIADRSMTTWRGAHERVQAYLEAAGVRHDIREALSAFHVASWPW
ncbi:unnamed protein product [Pedinophyceae sp. YPF-701]|nr:unnamed protein product [Pedinophyceae sp. YPF-701]